MPGKSSSERRALEAVERAVMGVFEAAGFDHVAPDIIQPADIFLERSGEDIRARTYVFADPTGAELCLRPDITVPACRYHLTHAARPDAESRYCYFGPAFRFAADATAPSEFAQAGLEWMGDRDPESAEAQILKIALDALAAAGLRDVKVTLGDLGLFRALLDDFDIPERWRHRLKHHFWRPQAFRDTLDLFTGDAVRLRTSISDHVDAVSDADIDRAKAWVEERLQKQNLALVGGRDVEEIAARLIDKAADRSERPLTRAEARRIHDYLAIEGDPESALAACRAMGHGKRFEAATMRFAKRIAKMRGLGLAVENFHFAATFGRNLEYYTGFVFQIDAGDAVQIAGGGRYDDLLQDMGAGLSVPAVGCAIHCDRLLAVAGGRSA
ncbi:MAG: ATP phosphoribosyltransferase regulatory subunit [Hyphomicrobiales bacterium]